MRRYYVDEYHFRHVPALPPGSRVLDLGGNKVRKRGQFDVGRYDLRVVYANLSTVKRPDVQADAEHVPFEGGSFDTVICSELLEHVPDPSAVLRESHRVLRSGGILMICVPFLFPIHGDPHDYGRYTGFYWEQTLAASGFGEIVIEKQGLFWSVLVDMLRELAYQTPMVGQPWSPQVRRLVAQMVGRGKRAALARDAQLARGEHPVLGSYTTGFGVRAAKT